MVKVRGSCTTEAKSHRVRVRHSITGKRTPMNNPKANNNSNPNTYAHPNLLHRSDYRLSSSCDVVDHLRNLDTP